MSLKRAGLTGRLNNQPRVTARRFSLSRISLRRFPFPSAPAAPAVVYVEDVYSTYLYTGTGSTQSIPNNIRLGDGATSSGWVSTLASGRSDIGTYIYSVAVDSGGNAYVCGVIGNSDFLLLKYNSSGVVQWQKTLVGSTQTIGYSVAVDGNDNVYVAGYTISGTDEAFLVKYNSSGTLQWQRTLGGTFSQIIFGMKVDSSGNVYITGDAGTAASGIDVLIAKYDTSGVLQWQRILGLGGSSVNRGHGLAVDNSGNVYISGIVSVSGNYRILTAKYDTSGVLQWQRRLTGGSTDDRGQGVAVDGSGNVYICGFTNSVGDVDIIVAKYDSSGVIQWQRRMATSLKAEYAYDIAADSNGNVYVVGISDSYDFQIVKYNSSGVFQWQRALTFGSISIYGESVTVDNNGLYVCGYAYLDNRYIALTAKLPTDGSGIGGYSVAGFTCQYKETLHSNSAFSLTNAASTLSNSAGALTNAASTLTEATGNLSSSLSTINTGTGFGGLVWMKGRSTTSDHALYDTARGATFDLASNLTDEQTTQSTGLTAFTNNGFTIGGLGKLNTSAAAYTSWTFRKQPKFFDVLTYTGTGAARTISHNLGSVPGMIIVKRTASSGSSFAVYHRSLATNQYVELSSSSAVGTNSAYWNNTAPTSSVFSVGTSTVTNEINKPYVAYLFAHDAGGFGLTGTDNVISCGTYLGNGGSTGPTVNLGYEPQWILIKNQDTISDWFLIDNVRGWINNGAVRLIDANTTDVENDPVMQIDILPNGFRPNGTSSAANLTNNYIYIAIRRGPMQIPTYGADVFQSVVYTGTNLDNRLIMTNILTDMFMARQRNSTTVGGFVVGDRLRGNQYLLTGSAAAGVTDADSLMTPTSGYGISFSAMNGFGVGNDATSQLNQSTVTNNHVVEAFRRAPGFLDVVTYTGTGSARTVSHNLGVAPEMIWVKCTTTGTRNWIVYSSFAGPAAYLNLNSNGDVVRDTLGEWNGTSPNTSVFTVGTDVETNNSGDSYVAYLMGSVPGVSKCSYYVGRGVGNVNQVDCGFTTGARFVIIKSLNRTGTAGDWYVYDSARGIISGNDPYLWPHSTSAEVTNTDYIDTYANGFELSTTAPDELNDGYGDFWSSQAAVLGTADINDIVYGGNLWVAGGSAGTIAYSANGYSWTTVAGVVTGGVNGITYGNGLYVAVGAAGRISTSANAITWSTRTSGTANILRSVTYGLGKFWASGDSGTVVSSDDGITWSTVSIGTSVAIQSINFLNNTLLLLGSSGVIRTSTDGVNFTARTSGVGIQLNGSTYGNNLYVVVGNGGDILTSPDLVTWTPRNSGVGDNLFDIVWTNLRFVAVGASGTVRTSLDGVTWSAGQTAGSFPVESAAFANDMIVAGNGDGDIYISDPKYIYWAIA